MVKSPLKPSLRERLNVSRWAIAHPKLTISFWIGVIMVGLFAFSSLKYALFPDVTFPVVVVNVTAPLTTALETEEQLTSPLENAVQTVERVYDLRSSTYPGRTVISLAFLVGTRLETATENVETLLKQAQLAPQTKWSVIPLNLNESTAITYAIQSETQSLDELTQIANTDIIPTIAQLPGVLKVNLLGDGLSRSSDTDIAALSSQTLVPNPPTLVRLNQQNGLAFQVIKRSDANTLEVVNQVENTIQSLQTQLTDIQLNIAETQADYIRHATQATIHELFLAILLAILVVFPFLRNWRATLITALAIPTSLIGTFIVMAIAGFNLETITLLALALVIGIVVDDAIVDVENISRLVDAGENPRQAAIQGTDEIGLTVTASTLTIAAVFLPVAFMGDALGQFFKPFALTISAAVLISLLVARTLSPVLAVYWLKPNAQSQTSEDVGVNHPLIQRYRKLLEWSLHHRKQTIAIALLSFAIGIALIPFVPQGFLPRLDRGEFNIIYTTKLPDLLANFKPQPSPVPNTPPKPTDANSLFSPNAFNWLSDLTQNPIKFILRKSRRTGEQIEEAVVTVPDVESVFTIAGIRGQPNKGKIYIKLKENHQLTTAETQDQIRKILPKLEDVTISVEDIQFVETGDFKPLQIVLVSDDLTLLSQTAQNIKQKVETLPGFVDVTVTGEENLSGTITQIEHFQRQRAAYLTANLGEGKLLGEATNQVVELAQPLLPQNVILKLTGDSARIGQVLRSFAVTLVISITLMLGLLLLLFGRLAEPIVVGLSLPLSIVGAMLALLITQSDFGIISVIGLIFLVGLLDKNALLLMDYINQLRQAGYNRNDAIIKTGEVRLRPIFMTTASTVLGMLPIAFGWGAGSELRQPMAVAIIGGLLTSTLLSLIIVPVLYTLLEDGSKRIKQNR